MPHVIVKMWPGKSEEQKAGVAQRITEVAMDLLNYGEESVSVRGSKSNQAIVRRRSISGTFVTRPRSSTRNPDTRCERYERSFIHSLSLMHSLWMAGTHTPRSEECEQ
jgi:4-oxalocrotonate tautomerase